MNRRDFLRTLAASLAVSTIPSALASLTREARLSGRITNRTFYLTETLVIEDHGVCLTGCTFIALPGFKGYTMVKVVTTGDMLIQGCHFDTREGGAEIKSALDIVPPGYTGTPEMVQVYP